MTTKGENVPVSEHLAMAVKPRKRPSNWCWLRWRLRVDYGRSCFPSTTGRSGGQGSVEWGSHRHPVVLRGRLKLHGGDNQGYRRNRPVAMPPETNGGKASPFALFYGEALRDGSTAVRP